MSSEGGRSFPAMGGFKRALLGYRRSEVDAAIAARDTHIIWLEQELPRIGELERETETLSEMVIEREREIRDLHRQLREASERADRSIASLDAVTARLEEIQAQARGQATRIRMKALREAVEVSRRVQDLAGQAGAEGAAAGDRPEPDAGSNGHGEIPAEDLFEGLVRVEVGPLGDFSQLVGFEDAAAQISAASEITVERFSEGRATISMRLGEPVALLRELESRSPLGFHLRETAPDRVVLDVDADEGSASRAA
jgi:hypothetical protein